MTDYDFSEDHDRHILLGQEANLAAESFLGDDFATSDPGVRSYVRAECAMVLVQDRINMFLKGELDKTALYEAAYLIDEAFASMRALGRFLDKEYSSGKLSTPQPRRPERKKRPRR